ncbi:MAG TPA: GNAT family N-acetyltransferase [Nocardioidaceae bacterium]|nr:GNAT family N-acetyltransferase [Nocardioidaceae bacterium]
MLDLRQVGFAHPDAALLIAEVQAEYVVRYGSPDQTPIDPTVFDAPAGAFYVGYLDSVPVATGGWRFRPDVTALGGSVAAEIKRMYVAPAARRTGLARVVLAHLESTALEAGADVMVLETGLRQPEAIDLYLSCGYEPIEGFGYYKDYPNVRYYGRRLST